MLETLYVSEISDHYFNFIVIKTVKPKHDFKNRPSVRLFSKENKIKFYNLMKNVSFNDIYFCNDVNSAFEALQCKLTSLFNEAFPITVISPAQFRDKCWITPSVKVSIVKKNFLYRAWIKSRNDLDLLEFKKYKAACYKIISAAKSKFYSEIFDTRLSNIKKFSSNLNSFFALGSNKKQINIYISSLTLENGEDITNKTDIANELNQYFTNIGCVLASQLKPINNKSFENYMPKPLCNSFYCEPITSAELESILKVLSFKKSAGYDELPLWIFKDFKQFLTLIIVYRFNFSLAEGIFPDCLKIAKVIPIFKKGSRKLMSNYGAISLLPSLEKIFEKIISKRFFNFINKNNILYKSQYGFRSKHSTIHALIDLVNLCSKNIDNKLHTMGIYIDVRKAFDSLDR